MSILIPQGPTVGQTSNPTRAANRGDSAAVPLLTHRIIQLADDDAKKVTPLLRSRLGYAADATAWFDTTFQWKPFLFQARRPDYFRKECGERLWHLVSLRFGTRNRQSDALVRQIRYDAESYFKVVLLAEIQATLRSYQPADVEWLDIAIRRGVDVKTLASSNAAEAVLKPQGEAGLHLRVLLQAATELFL